MRWVLLAAVAAIPAGVSARADEPVVGDTRVPEADARRAAEILAARPEVRVRARIADVKAVRLVGPRSVVLRTDRVRVERMWGEGEYGDHHTPPDALELAAGGRCVVGRWQTLTLLTVEAGRAVFHRVDRPGRRGDRVEEVIAVAPYEDARWVTDPNDPGRYTYTEVDDAGRVRLEKHYANQRLDGPWVTWYADGRKESEAHYRHDWRVGTWVEWHPNGRKRHEVTYHDDVATGRETWWDEDGRPRAIGEHPPPRG